MGNYAGLIVRGADGEDTRAGQDVTIIGDINGDGIDDFAISAPGEPYRFGSYDDATVYVVFGDDVSEISGGLPTALNVEDIDGTNGFAITADRDLFSFGELRDDGDFASSVSALGDVNGDGIDDFGITNRSTDYNYGFYFYRGYDSPYDGEGVAYVILGGQTFEATQEVDELAGFRIDVEGEVEGIVGLGDVNGDGIGDIAVNTVDRDAFGSQEIDTYYLYDADGNGVYDYDAASSAGFYGEYVYSSTLSQAIGQSTSYVIFGTDQERVSDDPIAGGGGFPIDVASLDVAAASVPEDAPTIGETIVNATQLDGSDGFSVQTGTTLTDTSLFFEGGNGGVYLGSSTLVGGVTSLGDINGDGIDDFIIYPVGAGNDLFDNYGGGGFPGTREERLLNVISGPDGNRTITLDVTTSYYSPYDPDAGYSNTESYEITDYSTFGSSSGSLVVFGNDSGTPFPAEIDPNAFPRPAEIEFRSDAMFDENDLAGVGNAVGNDGFDDVVTEGFLFEDEDQNTQNVFFGGVFLLPGSVNGLPDAAGADGTFFDENQLLADGDAAMFVDFTAGSIGSGFERLSFDSRGVEALGNVGGDAADDFAIIALRQDLNAPGEAVNASEGAVYLTFGSIDPLSGIIDLGASFVEGVAASDRPAYRIEGFENSFLLSVDGLGDVNGDGFNDLIIGDGRADGGGFNDGEVYVVFGGTGALSAADAADGVEDGIIDVDNLGVDVETGLLPIELSLRSNGTVSRSEGDLGVTVFEFIVDRSGDETQPVSFDFAVTPSGFDGADPEDFAGGALPTGTIDFEDGADFATVRVEVQGDFTQENTEDFTLTISNAVTAGDAPVSINRDTGTARIFNDDFPVNLFIGNTSVTEGDSDADGRELTFTVFRSGETDVEATVDYDVQFFSASADDFEAGTPLSGTVSFGIGETRATISLPIAEDNNIENNESIRVLLSNPTATAPAGAPDGTVVPITISDSSGTGTIITDDFAVQLQISNAFTTEGDVDSDNEELVFTVTRSGDTGPAVDVDVTFSSGSFRPVDAADFETDPFGTQTISFGPGDTSQQIRLPIDEDFNIESDERIEARLTNARSPIGEDIVVAILDSFGQGTIDNDDFPPRISVGGNAFQLEGPFGSDGGVTPFTFTIDRTGDTTGDTTVTFDLNPIPSEGNFFAANDADVASVVIDGVAVTEDTGNLLRPGYEVSFADGESSKTIVVNINDDSIIEPREQFELRIVEVETNNGTNYDIFTSARTATILNDDGRPPVIPVGVEADVFGDPHIVTLDGLGYDFQAVGEYILVETLPGATNAFQVQVRFEALPGSDLVSTTTRMAVNIGDDYTVEVDAKGDNPFLIIGPDGTVRTPTPEETALGVADVDGNGTGDFFFDAATGEFTVVLNDQNEQLKGKVMDGTMNVCVFLSDSDTGNQGNVRGLMGDADGDALDGSRDTTDDLALRAGTEVPEGANLTDLNGNAIPAGILAQDVALMQPVDFDTLYGIFADGWRLDGTDGKERAFSDVAPEFPDNFPAALLTVDDLPEQIRQEAIDAVLAAQDPNDPLDQSVFEAAVLDFALTGNPDFITGALGLAAEEEASTEPENSPDLPVSVSISVRPDEFTEGDSGTTPVTFTFFRLDDGALPLSIAYEITGTADAGDLEAGTQFSGTVDFAEGETESTIVIDVLGDMANEPDETLTVTITDSGGALVAGASATAVIGTDDFIPEAQDDVFSTDEVTRVEGDLFADNQVEDADNNSDSDADGDSFVVVELNGGPVNLFSAVTLPSGARLRLNEDGTFVYDPFGVIDASDPTDGFAFLKAGEVATDSFTYTISDGNGGEDTATVEITVQGVDNPPDANLDFATQSEDGPASVGNLLDNDVDPDTFDEVSGGDIAVSSISLGSQVASVTAAADGVLTLDNGATLTVAADGSYQFNTNGAFQDLHDRDSGAGSFALLNFTYTIVDPAGNDASALFQVTVTGENDAPVFDADFAFEVAENLTEVGTVSATDADAGDVVSYSLSGVDADLFDIDSTTGEISFVSAPDFEAPLDDDEGNDYEVTVEATDGVETTTQDVTITVTDVVENTAPVAQDGAITLDEDSENAGQLLFSDEQSAMEDLDVEIVSGVENGTLELGENGAFTYTPFDDFFGSDSFTYRVSDGELSSEIATISITVNPVNDLPDVPASAFATDEDTILEGVNVLDEAEDIDEDQLTVVGARTGDGTVLQIGVANALAQGGLLTIAENGDVSFDPNDDFEALFFNPQPEPPAITINFDVSDGSDQLVESTFTIGIDGVNDAPVADDFAFDVAENTTAVGQVTATDPEGDDLTFEITGGADADLFDVDAETGEVTFIAAPDFEAPADADEDNAYEVTIGVSDGEEEATSNVTVTVTDEDEAPNLIEDSPDDDFLLGTEGDDLFVFKGGDINIVQGLGGNDRFDLSGTQGNGTQDTIRLFDWSEGDLLEGLTLADIDLDSAFSFGIGLYFEYGPENDVMIVNGEDVPDILTDVFADEFLL
ncbi:MAG: Ig-like domain-containing protein [Roseobacter sp.]